MPAFTGRRGDSGEIEIAINAPGATIVGGLTAGTLTLTGGITAGSGGGAAWATTGPPVFGTNQAYLPISLGGTTYRIPLWLNA